MSFQSGMSLGIILSGKKRGERMAKFARGIFGPNGDRKKKRRSRSSDSSDSDSGSSDSDSDSEKERK